MKRKVRMRAFVVLKPSGAVSDRRTFTFKIDAKDYASFTADEYVRPCSCVVTYDDGRPAKKARKR